MVNMNAEAVNFEINRLQDCCAQYRTQLTERNGWIVTWFAKHNTAATPFAAAIDERDRAVAQLAEANAEITTLRETLSEKRNTGVKDSDGVPVFEGDTVSFSYGIPGVGVKAPIVFEGGTFYVETPEHNPKRCALRQLKKHVGDFWVEAQRDALQKGGRDG